MYPEIVIDVEVGAVTIVANRLTNDNGNRKACDRKYGMLTSEPVVEQRMLPTAPTRQVTQNEIV